MAYKIDYEKARLNGTLSIIILIVLVLCCIGLSFMLLHNPHKDLQKSVFSTAKRIQTYYRDRPGYWKLSTETAKNDNLLRADLLKYKEYDVQIGQGTNGDVSLPSDMSFNIAVKHLNKSACISLSEMPLRDEDKLTLMKISIVNAQNNIEFSWGGEPSLPVKKYSARNYCTTKDNIVSWTFQ